MPINFIERMRGVFADQPPYQWSVYEDSPWTPLAKPLEQCRVALISSCGVYRKDQEPFNPVRDDLTFREIPKDVNPKDLLISHNNYNHKDADQDVNIVLPLERFKELEQEGIIGELAPIAYTFMGRIFRRSILNGEMAPWLIGQLKDQRVDAAFLIPC